MAFEERLGILMERAKEEYDQVIKNADFSGENFVEEAKWVASIDLIYQNLDIFLKGCPMDVETMLFYDRPLAAFCERFPEKELLLLGEMNEALFSFLEDTRGYIHELCEQWKEAPLEELGKAQAFLTMERKIEELEEIEEREKMVRKQLQKEYHSNIENDYAGCLEYLKHYKELKGCVDAVFEENIRTIRARMMIFDGMTTEQLRAMAAKDEPLSAVYGCLLRNSEGELQNTEKIDAAILLIAGAQEEMESGTENELEH